MPVVTQPTWWVTPLELLGPLDRSRDTFMPHPAPCAWQVKRLNTQSSLSPAFSNFIALTGV